MKELKLYIVPVVNGCAIIGAPNMETANRIAEDTLAEGRITGLAEPVGPMWKGLMGTLQYHPTEYSTSVFTSHTND